MLRDVSTVELSEELESRLGVTSFDVHPYEIVRIISADGERVITGPAVVIINED